MTFDAKKMPKRCKTNYEEIDRVVQLTEKNVGPYRKTFNSTLGGIANR